jgi:hypothetical protein
MNSTLNAPQRTDCPIQLVFAAWLASQAGPLLFGADASTPLIDAFDFADSRTHWHTGKPPAARGARR